MKRAAPDEAGATSASDTGSEFAATISELRPHLPSKFARVAAATMSAPRSKPGSLADQESLALTPLLRDRKALGLARSQLGATSLKDLVPGVAIRANAPPEGDAKIREQIRRALPGRLNLEGRSGGKIRWSLDVIAANSKWATAAHFCQRVQEGQLFARPVVGGLEGLGAAERKCG